MRQGGDMHVQKVRIPEKDIDELVKFDVLNAIARKHGPARGVIELETVGVEDFIREQPMIVCRLVHFGLR
jgi:hypothetical protein